MCVCVCVWGPQLMKKTMMPPLREALFTVEHTWALTMDLNFVWREYVFVSADDIMNEHCFCLQQEWYAVYTGSNKSQIIMPWSKVKTKTLCSAERERTILKIGTEIWLTVDVNLKIHSSSGLHQYTAHYSRLVCSISLLQRTQGPESQANFSLPRASRGSHVMFLSCSPGREI